MYRSLLLRSTKWLRSAVQKHVDSANGSPPLRGQWLTNVVHPDLRAGIYCWTEEPRVELYESGLIFNECGPDGVHFKKIDVLRLLDLRALMLAGKDLDSPVCLGIETNEKRYRLVMHLFRYTTLASLLPHMVMNCSDWPASGNGVDTPRR